MIRLIDLTGQITCDETDKTFLFAWFNTVTDTFMNFNDSQIWYSWENFELDFRFEEIECGKTYEFERFREIFDGYMESKKVSKK